MVPLLRVERRKLLLLRELTLPICPQGLNIFMTYVYVLMVLVVADGEWREWNSYPTMGACQQLIAMHTRYRDDKIKAYCVARPVSN